MPVASVYAEEGNISTTSTTTPKSIRLTDHEKDQMTIGPSISTITFFRGDIEKATAQLKDRLRLILGSNPWLTGRLMCPPRQKEKGLYLEYPDSASNVEEKLDSLFNPQPSKKGGKLPQIASTMTYSELCKLVGGTTCEVLPGKKCINNSKPLLALSLVPDKETPLTAFAVIFSISHVIIDGYTYYKVLSMLSAKGIVSPLNIVRKPDIKMKTDAAMGMEEAKWSSSTAVICNVVSAMLFGKKPFIENFTLDPMIIEAEKRKVTKVGSDDRDRFGQTKPSFVSTNDSIVSKFGQACQSRILLMPINFRERIADFSVDDAGNYEGALVFCPGDYEIPEMIRATIESGKENSESDTIRISANATKKENITNSDTVNEIKAFKRCTTDALPNKWETLRCKLGMVTNWQFHFFSEFSVDNCEHILHLPFCNVKIIPFDIAVIYRPKANETAVLVFVRSTSLEDFKNIMPFKNKME